VIDTVAAPLTKLMLLCPLLVHEPCVGYVGAVLYGLGLFDSPLNVTHMAPLKPLPQASLIPRFSLNGVPAVCGLLGVDSESVTGVLSTCSVSLCLRMPP